MPITQHITATIAVSGPDHTEIASFGDGGTGSFISVRSGNALAYVHDQLAAECYDQAWLGDDTAALSLHLSATPRPMVVDDVAAFERYPRTRAAGPGTVGPSPHPPTDSTSEHCGSVEPPASKRTSSKSWRQSGRTSNTTPPSPP